MRNILNIDILSLFLAGLPQLNSSTLPPTATNKKTTGSDDAIPSTGIKKYKYTEVLWFELSNAQIHIYIYVYICSKEIDIPDSRLLIIGISVGVCVIVCSIAIVTIIVSKKRRSDEGVNKTNPDQGISKRNFLCIFLFTDQNTNSYVP